MNIKVHRGLNQIGGCITEIWTNTSRVFIDFGQNLPGNGELTTSEQDFGMVIDIIDKNMKEHEAVFYTMPTKIMSACSGISLLISILEKEAKNCC